MEYMTENKRYFKRMWEEEYYIFDSNAISESDFEEKLEYQNYKAFEDSMMGDEVVNRLNELNDENKQSKMMIATLRNIVLENENLEKENKELKQQLESEHTMLDNAILLERTRMGKNSLIQYKEAIM